MNNKIMTSLIKLVYILVLILIPFSLMEHPLILIFLFVNVFVMFVATMKYLKS